MHEKRLTSQFIRFYGIIILILMLTAGPAGADLVKTFRLQIGSFGQASEAEDLRQRAVSRAPLPVFVDELVGQHKVTVGNFNTYSEAASYKDRLYGEGFEGAFIVEVLTSVSEKRDPVYKIQIGNFASLVNARQLQEELRNRGVDIVTIDRIEGYYKVRVGEYKTIQEATEDKEILQEAGYPDAWITDAIDVGARVESRVISISPATMASLTPEPAVPGKVQKLYQVTLGPFTKLSLAESTRNAMSREGFSNVELIAEGGNYLIHAGAARNLLLANDLAGVLKDKGYRNIYIREVQPEPTTAGAEQLPAEVEEELERLRAEVQQLRSQPVSEQSPDKMAEAHVKAAQRLSDQGHFQAARDQFDKALELDPANQAAMEGYSSTLNAIREQERIEQKQNVDVLLASAQRLFEAGELRAAELEIRNILENSPGNEQALQLLGKIEQQREARGDYAEEEAAGVAQEPPAGALDSARILQNTMQQADKLIEQGQLSQALSILQNLQKQYPNEGSLRVKIQQINQQMAAQSQAAQQQPQQQQQQQQPGQQPRPRPAPPQPEPEAGISWTGFILYGLVILLVIGAIGGAVFYFLVMRKPSTGEKKKKKEKPGKKAPTSGKLEIMGLDKGKSSAKEKKKEKAEPKKKEPEEKTEEKPAPEQPPESAVEEMELPEELDEVPSVKPLGAAAEQKEKETPVPDPKPVFDEEPEEVDEETPDVQPEPTTPPLGPMVSQSPFTESEDKEKKKEEEKVEEKKEETKEETKEEEEISEEKPSAEKAVVFEQHFNDYESGDEVDSWKGAYEHSTLTVSQNRLIAGENKYLKFIKETSPEETLFCTIVPDAGPVATYEYEICCLGVNEHPIGLHLESVDNEKVSLAAKFQTNPDTQEIEIYFGEKAFSYNSGDWLKISCQVNIEKKELKINMNGENVVPASPLPEDVNSLDLISMKAAPETEGTLLLKNLKVLRG